MQSTAFFAAAGVTFTVAPVPAARDAAVVTLAAAALLPVARTPEIVAGPGLFAETLRVAEQIAHPKKRRDSKLVVFDLGAGVDGQSRLVDFRAFARDIIDRVASWATLGKSAIDWMGGGIDALLHALVRLLRQMADRCRVHTVTRVRTRRERLKSLSIAPGAPPEATRQPLLEGLAAA